MWRIYYRDGTHEDGAGSPVGERARGVQVVLQSDPDVGWFMQSGSDYYVWRDGRWWGVDIFGLFDFLMDTGLVLFGRTISNREYRRVFERAKEDRALAEKQTHLARGQERVPE